MTRFRAMAGYTAPRGVDDDPPRCPLHRLPRLTALAVIVLAASAHIGTNDTVYAGMAGPYPVRVTVRQPGVIPGLADITVRTEDRRVSRVLVTALQRLAQRGQAPPPDAATPVPGEEGLFAAQLWLMVRGAHSVIVTIEGDAGRGSATIPIVAAANTVLPMSGTLLAIVAGGGLFLLIGLLTLIAAAARESVLAPGDAPAAADRRRARFAVAFGAIVVALILFGGWTWIRAENEQYRQRIDRPWNVAATMRATIAGPVLDFAITDSLWVQRDNPQWLSRAGRYRRAEMIPDHGKMMHMFIIGLPEMHAFAHVHPVRTGPNDFTVRFPPLPAGRYRIYADIVHEDGTAHTLTASVDATTQTPAMSPTAPAASAAGDAAVRTAAATTSDSTAQHGRTTYGTAGTVPDLDPDDGWWTGSAQTAAASLDDGSTMQWVNAAVPLVAGQDAELVIEVRAEDGSPAVLEPYMGMPAHAMLNRADGDVFVHIHPSGMISMAAQQALDRAVAADTTTAGSAGFPMTHAPGDMLAPGASAGIVRFPFVAPSAGHYRLWVQIRRGGRVLTGAFDAVIR